MYIYIYIIYIYIYIYVCACAFTGNFVYIWLTISSCYGSSTVYLGGIGRDGGLSTLCHSCGFACQ